MARPRDCGGPGQSLDSEVEGSHCRATLKTAGPRWRRGRRTTIATEPRVPARNLGFSWCPERVPTTHARGVRRRATQAQGDAISDHQRGRQFMDTGTNTVQKRSSARPGPVDTMRPVFSDADRKEGVLAESVRASLARGGQRQRDGGTRWLAGTQRRAVDAPTSQPEWVR